MVIIPNYKESLSHPEQTLDNLGRQYQARPAHDDCAGDGSGRRRLGRERPQFAGANISAALPTSFTPSIRAVCRARCSANPPIEAWAARWIKRRLVDELGYDIDHILVTTMDADTLWHKRLFLGAHLPVRRPLPSAICVSGRPRSAITPISGTSARRCA